MKDTTKKEITKEELKKKIEDTLNFYEMTGSYIEGAKRHDYKHYDKLSKENIVRELTTLFNSQIDRIREDSVNEIFDLIQCRGENCMWCRGNGDCGNMLTDEFVKNRRKQFKEYLESKSGGIK
jgi:hypothetical protein